MNTPNHAAPLPAGAVAAEAFEVRSDGRCLRFFQGTRRGCDDVYAEIVGLEEYNGLVVRRAIYLDVDRLDNELDAATARQLARNLIAAADELDDLSERDSMRARLSDAAAIIEP